MFPSRPIPPIHLSQEARVSYGTDLVMTMYIHLTQLSFIYLSFVAYCVHSVSVRFAPLWPRIHFHVISAFYFEASTPVSPVVVVVVVVFACSPSNDLV